jgi:hypothetical protein
VRRLIIVITVLSALVAAPGASSDPPLRELLPPLGEYTSTACGFPVVIETVHENFTLKVFPEGRPVLEMVTGSAVLRLTSEDASLTLNVSGPTFVRQSADGSVTVSGAGPWLFFDHPFTNLPPLAYLTGTITFGEDTVTASGRTVDLCALLA